MSRFKKFLKPRTNRPIAGLAIVGLIILGSYLAYKNNIFADTPASGCNITARIVQNFPGAHPIYLLDETNYNLVTNSQNPNYSNLNIIHSLSNGEAYSISNSGNLYFAVHTDAIGNTGHPKLVTDPQKLVCNTPKTVEVTATFTSTTSATISHTEQPIGGGAQTYQCKYFRFPGTTVVGAWYANQNGTWYRIDGNSITQTTLAGNYNEEPSATGMPSFCSSDSQSNAADLPQGVGDGVPPNTAAYQSANQATTSPGASELVTSFSEGEYYCVKSSLTATGATFLYSNSYFEQQESNSQYPQSFPESSKGQYQISRGRCGTASATTSPGASGTTPASVTASTELKCFGVRNTASAQNLDWAWYGKNTQGKWQRVDSSSKFVGDQFTNAPGDEATTDADKQKCGTKPVPGTAAGTTSGVQYKCALFPPQSVAAWYYKRQNDWKNTKIADTRTDIPSANIRPDAECGAKPATAPSDALISAEKPDAVIDGKPPADPEAPVSGTRSSLQSPEYKNKIAFTAYRTSYKESSQIVPVGGATFTAIAHLNNSLAGPAKPIASLQNRVTRGGKAFVNELQCSTQNNILMNTVSKLFGHQRSMRVMTPDQGPVSAYTALVNASPGLYQINVRKPGFESASACFQVSENDGVEAGKPLEINILLTASVGAEPPGMTSGLTGIWAGQDSRERTYYQTGSGNGLYKYMPDYPWYGWQPNDSYITATPIGYDATGVPQPGIFPAYGEITNWPEYLSKCQSFNVNLKNIDKKKMGWLGAIISGLGAINSGADADDVLLRTALGGAIGYGLGSGLEGSDITWNFAQINEQCRQIYDMAIPSQCRICLTVGFDNQNCPADCVRSLPVIRGIFGLGAF